MAKNGLAKTGLKLAKSGRPNAPAAFRRFHTTTRELQTCTCQAPALQKPPKFHEKTPRETQKERRWWRDSEKKTRNFESPPFGAPKGVCSSMLFFHLCCSVFFRKRRPEVGRPNFWPKSVNSGWPKSVKFRLAKVGLAKVGLAQVGQLRMAKIGISLLQSCSIVVRTLATSDRRHQGCVHCGGCAPWNRKSVCHHLFLPVVDPRPAEGDRDQPHGR